MFKIINNDFKIVNKYKKFLMDLDAILENVPRKDMYFKDKIRTVSVTLLYEILEYSYSSVTETDKYMASIKGKISFLDFCFERLYDKKYVSEKAIFKLTEQLVEINKMTSGWLLNGSKA